MRGSGGKSRGKEGNTGRLKTRGGGGLTAEKGEGGMRLTPVVLLKRSSEGAVLKICTDPKNRRNKFEVWSFDRIYWAVKHGKGDHHLKRKGGGDKALTRGHKKRTLFLQKKDLRLKKEKKTKRGGGGGGGGDKEKEKTPSPWAKNEKNLGTREG